jgi:hypothetical protein
MSPEEYPNADAAAGAWRASPGKRSFSAIRRADRERDQSIVETLLADWRLHVCENRPSDGMKILVVKGSRQYPA